MCLSSLHWGDRNRPAYSSTTRTWWVLGPVIQNKRKWKNHNQPTKQIVKVNNTQIMITNNDFWLPYILNQASTHAPYMCTCTHMSIHTKCFIVVPLHIDNGYVDSCEWLILVTYCLPFDLEYFRGKAILLATSKTGVFFIAFLEL